jgi:hypothetical protein
MFGSSLRKGSAVLCAAVATVMAFASSAEAQKGSTGGGGGGTTSAEGLIFFGAHVGWDWHTWTMNRTGGSKTALSLIGWHEPSFLPHPSGGQHWMLGVYEVAGEFYHDGRQRMDMYAVRADGAASVRLTSHPNVEVQFGGWVPGDNKMYYAGVTWNNGQAIAAGVYIADIVYNNGIPAGLSQQIVSPTFDTGMVEESGWYTPKIWYDLTWSPDGSKFIYVEIEETTWWAVPGMRLVDWATGSVTVLLPDRIVAYPNWSPAGDLIAFEVGNSIWTIMPDGTGLKIIIKSANNRRAAQPKFSPTGTEIVYAWKTTSWPYESSVYRATSAGKQSTNLTSNFGYSTHPVGWR